MEKLTLKNEAFKLIENLPESKIKYVISFAKFISQQDFLESEVPNQANTQRLPLGFLSESATVTFSDDWEISPEELLSL